MKSAPLRRALGLAFLYIGAFVLLVLLQFSRAPGFNEKFGTLSVIAAFPKAQSGKSEASPESLHLSFAGLRLSVTDASPARIVRSDGFSKDLVISSIAKLRDGVRIRFEGGVDLRATVAQDESLVVDASAPTGTAELRLRYDLRSGKLAASGSNLVLESSGNAYDLSLASARMEAGWLSLKPAPSGLGTLSVKKRVASVAKPSGIASDKLVFPAPKDEASFVAEIAAWRDKAWTGLSVSRFDAESLTWRDFEGNSRFSEKALAAYIAEAFARGFSTEARARAKIAKERWPDSLGYLTAPFLGGLVPKMQALEESDRVEAKRLAQLVADKSPELFAKENLIHFLLDRAPFALAQEVLRFAAEIDPAKLSLRQALGLLGCLVESRSYLKEEENPFRALGSVADRIVTAVRETEEGYFLVIDEDGATEFRLSLLAGLYLASFGRDEAKPALVGLGQGLIEGALGLADDRGFMPSRAFAHGALLEQKSGHLAPEDLYPSIADNPYYPREVSFYRDVAPGVWAWTCAPELSVAASSSRYVFRARFPVGLSHYLTFYGIKGFANIQLYDIDYSADAQFEIYDASGYLYRKATSSLYIKMKHKKENEDIKLYF